MATGKTMVTTVQMMLLITAWMTTGSFGIVNVVLQPDDVVRRRSARPSR